MFSVNEYYCGNKPADVVFLLDSSNSIWGPYFHKQLQFVKDVVSMFQIDTNTTRIGIVTYASSVQEEFYLDEFLSKHGVMAAIDRIGQMRGFATHKNRAIRIMRQKMFAKEHGARDGVARIGIVLTDGQSSNMLMTVWEASKAKKANIDLFSVGIGSKINKRELKMIASRPSSEYFFEVADFSALQNIKDMLAVRTCRGKESKSRNRRLISLSPPLSFLHEISITQLKITTFLFVFSSYSQTNNNNNNNDNHDNNHHPNNK